MLIPWREAILVSGNAGVEAGRIPYGAASGSGALDDSVNGPQYDPATNTTTIGGTANGIDIVGDSIKRNINPGALRLGSDAQTRWQFQSSSGHFNPEADNTHSLGVLGTGVALLALAAGGRRILNSKGGTVSTGGGATGTIVASNTLEDNAVTQVLAYVTGGKSDESEGCGYWLVGTYRRTGGGAPTICGAVTAVYTGETDATANATLVVVGNTVEVQGTSPAGDTYDWFASIDLVRRP